MARPCARRSKLTRTACLDNDNRLELEAPYVFCT